MSAKLIVLLAVIAVAQCRVKRKSLLFLFTLLSFNIRFSFNIVTNFVIMFSLLTIAANPLYRYLDNVAKREPGACAYQCVPTCYDDGYGSYNHRSGSCSKAGYSCCEWQVGKREESKQDLSGNHTVNQ